MSDGKGFLEKLYEKLWLRAGGKPWTEIVREEQKASPLAFMLIFFFLGVMVVKLTGRRWWWIALAFATGIIAGHFWW